MNSAITSRSAWSQSLSAVLYLPPPACQSSRARRSICAWTPKCVSTVNAAHGRFLLDFSSSVLAALPVTVMFLCLLPIE